ncbi:MAG TPA: beta-propeller fold lactonase family protein [Nocardioides sp.]|uniref:beta-propeller fold lactonase family protein n=1 Tax=Nocardioides sp. TaxID=35761 RepID=UPI002E3464D1|nr:beta-propeller fold lactonase family protein [Nocardioides sp.]HEX5090524.1 beta-propeller fold lactonase family protein [Nocardioides sp.]
MNHRTLTPLLTATAAAVLTAVGLPGAASAHGARPVGHVYEATNAASGNGIGIFDRYADGTLEPAGVVPTGGLGAGASLHSQGGLARDGHLIFAVNAGDDTVSALYAGPRGLELRDTVSSHGDFPVSVTVRDGIGYVLNQNSDTISAFRYERDGDLRAIPQSTRSLTPNPAGGITDAAQVSFAPDGRTIVVTEKASNTIDTFAVRHGLATAATPHRAAGTTPYGFDFDRAGHAIVSEAASGSASSYGLQPFRTITAALADTQRAACWLVVARGHAFVVNAASASVSSYAIGPDGSLTLRQAVAGTASAGATDAAVSPDQRTLAVRLADGSVQTWKINGDGSLTSVGTAAASAIGSAGLVAD